jgi:hypothetical protein
MLSMQGGSLLLRSLSAQGLALSQDRMYTLDRAFFLQRKGNATNFFLHK